ncbi:hypothetical protein MNBD_GAMMA13-441, partial [hydrothermal vent metagenome]
MYKQLLTLSISTLSVLTANPTMGVTFSDIVTGDGAGIQYRRGESTNDVLWDSVRQGIFQLQDLPGSPGNTRGAPGVALLDYDRDGDLDIYVTNGPGKANSLYSNQLKETGVPEYIDLGLDAGVAASDQDSTGVCFGDTDNDGDPDLLVLGRNEPNRLFENQGDGSFVNISASSQIGLGVHNPSSCAMGDINNDGLLDIYIGNSYNDWSHRLPIMLFGFESLIEENQLYVNTGSNIFSDVSASSGILTQKEITWAVSMVDYDQDGDLDIISGDDQGGRIPAYFGGADVGFIRIYNNDGTGNFTDVTDSSGTMQYGAWMGLAFGDLNHDGQMDMFASNFGDYAGIFTKLLTGIPYVVGDWHSSWFFGDDSGQFTREPAGAVVATPFGWGAAISDYDNDGDADIVFHGGGDFALFQDGTNPGAVLQNDGTGNFTRDSLALTGSTDHTRRNVKGVAMGDLNNDGFPDIVSVSGQDWPTFAPLVPMLPFPLGGPFDSTAMLWPAFFPLDQQDPAAGFVWSDIDPLDGTLSVEINNAEDNNHWVKVRTLGTVGITSKGQVNRDGIGAIIRFTPNGGQTAMTPVQGGSSYASQNSLAKTFGMSTAA